MSEEKQTNIVEHSTQSPLMALMQSAATDPNVDVEKMERIFALYERDQDREAEKAFNSSMVEVQKAIEPVRRKMKNEQTKSKYADLADVAQEVNDKFTANGFSISFYQEDSPCEGHIRIVADIMHSQGHTKKRHVDMPLVNTGLAGKVNMTMTHATGSAFSYGRRYLTLMVANLPTPDDDGNAAQSTYERISDDQALTIHAFLDENNLDIKAFDDWMKRVLKVPSIEEIPLARYPDVMRALNKKVA